MMNEVLSVKDLTISINSKKLVQNVSFCICEGDRVLLSGPNGAGKSTIMKAMLRLESEGKDFDGQIISRSYGNILELNYDDIQRFRASVAYVQQKDEYSMMSKVQVRDIINQSGDSYSGKTLTQAEVNDLIDEWIPRNSDNKRIFDANSKPAKFSGGEQRLLSVLSAIVTRPDAELFIIDEPLNNLDFVNARHVSNLINRVIRNNPKMVLLMVSHCRIFPFITREIRLDSDGASEVPDHYVCHSCFGDHDEQGFYLLE